MSILTYPRSIWTPPAFFARQRNAAGERIRVDGARMNDTECCCDDPDPCTICTGGSAPTSITVTIPTIIDGANAGLCDVLKDCDVSSGTYVVTRHYMNTFPGGCIAQYGMLVTPEMFCKETPGLRHWFIGVWLQWRYTSGTNLTDITVRTREGLGFGTDTPPIADPEGAGGELDSWYLEISGLLNCSDETQILPIKSPNISSDRCEASDDAEASW